MDQKGVAALVLLLFGGITAAAAYHFPHSGNAVGVGLAVGAFTYLLLTLPDAQVHGRPAKPDTQGTMIGVLLLLVVGAIAAYVAYRDPHLGDAIGVGLGVSTAICIVLTRPGAGGSGQGPTT
ncbi:hypothetical protein [Streptacidiphilus carbonis]|uniref:hypothetical protein n=1 Tax=Streptacidiphilus carbonis TaxID=105422 RepID=UPI0005A8614C|nr:hypothetical protein [Streptacidiphilus carbonis]